MSSAAVSGFSLIELMVAMVLSLVLLGGALAVFSCTRSTYESIDQLSRIQENGRFALDRIAQDIRSAGYVGCAKSVRYWNSSLRTPSSLAWNFSNPVQGFEGSTASVWLPALDATIASSSPTGLNDILVVRTPKPGAAPSKLSSGMANGTSPISITAQLPAPLAVSDVAMISNCEAQSFFEVTGYSVASGVATVSHAVSSATSTTPGNISADLGYAFPIDSEIIPVITNTYFVAPSTVGTSTSLWRKNGTSSPEELIEGVDRMQVRFGVDTNSDQMVDNYVDANSVTNWGNVITVRVALLVRSLEQFGNSVDSKTYTVLNTTTTAYGDRRQRQVFTSTITLRNKTL